MSHCLTFQLRTRFYWYLKPWIPLFRLNVFCTCFVNLKTAKIGYNQNDEKKESGDVQYSLCVPYLTPTLSQHMNTWHRRLNRRAEWMIIKAIIQQVGNVSINLFLVVIDSPTLESNECYRFISDLFLFLLSVHTLSRFMVVRVGNSTLMFDHIDIDEEGRKLLRGLLQRDPQKRSWDILIMNTWLLRAQVNVTSNQWHGYVTMWWPPSPYYVFCMNDKNEWTMY